MVPEDRPSAPTTPTRPNYPIARPPTGDQDPRFNYGLFVDLSKVLTDHGYPSLAGVDYPRFMGALFEVIYGRPSSEEVAAAMAATASTSARLERAGDASLALRPIPELSPLRSVRTAAEEGPE